MFVFAKLLFFLLLFVNYDMPINPSFVVPNLINHYDMQISGVNPDGFVSIF